MRSVGKFLLGWAKLLLFPLATGLGLVATLVHPVADTNLYLVTILILGACLIYYPFLMLQRVQYRAEVVDGLDFAEIPAEVRDLITETTMRGHFINRAIILSFANGKKLSMTDIHNRIKREGIGLSQQAERPYIGKLVEKGIIYSPVTRYEKELTLTSKGRWYRGVIESVLPSRYFMFVVRNELGLRPNIPSFPAEEQVPT
jgi:hypothetical protein